MLHIICDKPDMKRAAHFFGKTLGLTNGTVVVETVTEGEHHGVCDFHKRGNLALILINTDREDWEEDMLETLAHEMVHAKQYLTGELEVYDGEENNALWQGKLYSLVETDSHEYWFAPWEVEAFGKQIGLVQLYLQELEKGGSIH